MRAQFVLQEIWIGLRRNLTMTVALIVVAWVLSLVIRFALSRSRELLVGRRRHDRACADGPQDDTWAWDGTDATGNAPLPNSGIGVLAFVTGAGNSFLFRNG